MSMGPVCTCKRPPCGPTLHQPDCPKVYDYSLQLEPTSVAVYTRLDAHTDRFDTGQRGGSDG